MWELMVLLLGLAALLGAVLYARYTRGILRRLEKSVDEAARGDFRPGTYDESRLSRWEAKLADLLSAGVLSRTRLEADRQCITETIGDLSHQTRTPIANLRLYTELLEEQPLPDGARECAARLAEQTDRLDFLIRALVKTSRLETGVVRPMPRLGNVSELVEAVASTCAPGAAEKGLSLTWDCPKDAEAWFDPKWTAEALGNLVDNAVKYTAAGGVTISACPYELFCRVDVADTGPGVPESEQAGIFRRFYRGAAASGAEGVGIGLHLARQILTAESGYIKIANRPGGGAVFSAYLPRDQKMCQSC